MRASRLCHARSGIVIIMGITADLVAELAGAWVRAALAVRVATGD